MWSRAIEEAKKGSAGVVILAPVIRARALFGAV
jgi:hypothetical protein